MSINTKLDITTDRKFHSNNNLNDFWKILIADDEEDVHSVTKMVLEDVEFEGRKLQFLSAYSGKETIQILKEHPDIAIVLLDVVMENESSGLDAVKAIREDLKNSLVRIILRTGQPGQAPERTVIAQYDINDYKEKTELTSQKLYTAITASLRSYRDMKLIERNRLGLENIIQSTSLIFGPRDIDVLTRNILNQIVMLLTTNTEHHLESIDAFLAGYDRDNIHIYHAINSFKDLAKSYDRQNLPGELIVAIDTLTGKKNIHFTDNEFYGYFEKEENNTFLIYCKTNKPLCDIDISLLKVFTTNIDAALDNYLLNREISNTQKEVILTLGEVVETRSKETAFHVKRVAEISRLLAEKYGLSPSDVELVRMASPMHDVGKIGIADNILNKPGRLTNEEFDIMKTHTNIGYDILKSSNRKILQAASIIALQHHERWDGLGYPNGLKENEIHIFSQITSIVDVFDALSHKRIYKDAWELDKVLEFLREQRGAQFNPKLTDLFFKNLDEILQIKLRYPDETESEIFR